MYSSHYWGYRFYRYMDIMCIAANTSRSRYLNFCQANAQVEESVDVSVSVLPLQVFVLVWDV